MKLAYIVIRIRQFTISILLITRELLLLLAITNNFFLCSPFEGHLSVQQAVYWIRYVMTCDCTTYRVL